MFKSLKDAKRRVVEKMLETVNASERTTDEEFEMHYAKFTHMISDLNESGAGLHSLLVQQKTFFKDALEVANNFDRIHEQYDSRDYWPGVSPHLSTTHGAQLYKEKMDLIHNVIRSSTALVNLEQALEPLRQVIAEIGPTVEATVKERNTIVIDMDSYRRRVKAAKEKKENLEKQGKGNSPAYAENQNEIVKFETKEQNATTNFEEKNAMAKQQIIDARSQHDVVFSDAFVTTVVCQHELYSRAAKELETVMAALPKEKVDKVKKELSELVRKGGVREEKEEKSNAQKGFAIFTGKAVPSDFKKEEAEASAPPASALAPTVTLTSKSSNPFGEDSDDVSAKPAPPAAASRPPPPPAAAETKKKVTVKALFDHVAEADDELNFSVGDVIEVVATSDDGWWKGRVHGNEGLFPVNYVDTAGM